MLISHRKKFIYTKTIKTAGTSVEAYFEPYCFPPGEYQFLHARPQYESEAGVVGFRGLKREDDGNYWYHHAPAHEIRARAGDEVWNSYFKFCVIRDPFEKLVSAFHHFALPKEECASMAFHEIRQRFSDWMHTVRLAYFDDWNIFTIDDQIAVDYVIRYERLVDGLRHVCGQLQVPFEPGRLQRIKSEYNPHLRPAGDYYDSDTVTLAATVYARQIMHFGFRLPVSPSPEMIAQPASPELS